MSNLLNKIENNKTKEGKFLKLSYDIKNPLTVCIGYLELLNNATDTEKEKYIEIIRKEINNSIEMIDNFSDEIKKRSH